MGKLIVLEGLDGTGKSTQLALLKAALPDAAFTEFPHYERNTGAVISEYLAGDYPEENPKTSACAASLFYAVDRYKSLKLDDWAGQLRCGRTVISGRYTTSNAIYQTAKLSQNQWEDYISWLYDLEYDKLGLPKPDLVLYLEMPLDISQKMLDERYRYENHGKKDVHEADGAYLSKCAESARYLAKRDGWRVINCADDGKPRTKQDIHREILKLIESQK